MNTVDITGPRLKARGGPVAALVLQLNQPLLNLPSTLSSSSPFTSIPWPRDNEGLPDILHYFLKGHYVLPEEMNKYGADKVHQNPQRILGASGLGVVLEHLLLEVGPHLFWGGVVRKWRDWQGISSGIFYYFWAQGSFSGSHWIARPGKNTFETVLSALGGAAPFSKEGVGTPDGAIRPAFPWEHSREQAHPLWCFLTAGDRLECLADLLACDY